MLLRTFHYMQGMLFLESVTINPPNWSFLGSFWPASGQVVKRGWLSRGPARFGSDLKTEEKLDPGQTGRRTATAWPVDTSHMNPLAEAEADTLKAHGAADVVFHFSPSTTAEC